MTESQFLIYVLAGAGVILSALTTLVWWMFTRSIEKLDRTLQGIQSDVKTELRDVKHELQAISQRVNDNSEAVSGRISDVIERVVRLETYCEDCKRGNSN